MDTFWYFYYICSFTFAGVCSSTVRRAITNVRAALARTQWCKWVWAPKSLPILMQVFGVSASQYGGPGPGQMYAIGPPPLPPPIPHRRSPINYFILPVFIIQCIGIACLVCLWGYLRYVLIFLSIFTISKIDFFYRFSDLFPYRKREFWCNDPELMYRNLAPDKFMYMSDDMLYSISLLIPPFVVGQIIIGFFIDFIQQIIVGEICFWLFSTKPRKTVYSNCRECTVHLFTRRVLRFLGNDYLS